MTTVQKFLTGLFGIALVTTLILPDRQTVPVIDATGHVLTTSLGTAMGTFRPR